VPDEGELGGSDARSTYDEYQVSARQLWANNQQVFVSYVRSSARGELNDFMTLFTGFVPPCSRADVRCRQMPVIGGWLDRQHAARPGVSPVMEWHPAFHSRLDSYFYLGEPYQASFPAFMAVDRSRTRP
jgi:hypothetical protein